MYIYRTKQTVSSNRMEANRKLSQIEQECQSLSDEVVKEHENNDGNKPLTILEIFSKIQETNAHLLKQFVQLITEEDDQIKQKKIKHLSDVIQTIERVNREVVGSLKLKTEFS